MPEQSPKKNNNILVAIIGGFFVIIAACIGWGNPIIEWALDQIDKQTGQESLQITATIAVATLKEITSTPVVSTNIPLPSSNSDITNTPTIIATAVLTDAEPNTNDTTLSEEKTITSKVAVGAYNDYEFEGKNNVPVIITVERTSGNLVYELEIYEPNGDKVEESGSYYSILEQPFTPQENGVYVARVVGTKDFGEYWIGLSFLDEQPTIKEKVLVSGAENQSDAVAIGAYDDYKFDGKSNVPVIITVEKTSGHLIFDLEIYDPEGTKVEEASGYYTTLEQPFTPKVDGVYVARVIGTKDFGEYLIKLEEYK